MGHFKIYLKRVDAFYSYTAANERYFKAIQGDSVLFLYGYGKMTLRDVLNAFFRDAHMIVLRK